jgi:hypothetical protein
MSTFGPILSNSRVCWNAHVWHLAHGAPNSRASPSFCSARLRYGRITLLKAGPLARAYFLAEMAALCGHSVPRVESPLLGLRPDIRFIRRKFNTPANQQPAHQSPRRCSHCAMRRLSNGRGTAASRCRRDPRITIPAVGHCQACRLKIQRADVRGWPFLTLPCPASELARPTCEPRAGKSSPQAHQCIERANGEAEKIKASKDAVGGLVILGQACNVALSAAPNGYDDRRSIQTTESGNSRLVERRQRRPGHCDRPRLEHGANQMGKRKDAVFLSQ